MVGAHLPFGMTDIPPRARDGGGAGVSSSGEGGAIPLEQGVVRRAQEGDAAAFEQLYRTHAGRVYALCLRMSGDRERARELAHDAFVRAWERLASYRGEAAFGTWLHRLTVNVVLERQRGERRRQAHEVTASDLATDDGDEEQGDRLEATMTATVRGGQVIPRDVDRMELEAAIASLPRNARMVFVLHAVEGYRHDEIAQVMAIAEGTVRAHLHRARRLLMEFLTR